ncbi:MAG TPA: hypothetical protein DIT64_21500 [Verrucomicrobiales bacterium]|nr:hypothetical protein [Verrucomicrobiales bacterium]
MNWLATLMRHASTPWGSGLETTPLPPVRVFPQKKLKLLRKSHSSHAKSWSFPGIPMRVRGKRICIRR